MSFHIRLLTNVSARRHGAANTHRVLPTPALLCSTRTRFFSTTQHRRQDAQQAQETSPNIPISKLTASPPIYTGTLSSTYTRLKMFSLSSLFLASSLTPLMFIIDSALPFGARATLAAAALGTSGLSTGLIGWGGRPYVYRMWNLADVDPAQQGLLMETRNVWLKERYTIVYDPALLVPSNRPFAECELPDRVALPGTEESEAGSEEETVAITTNKQGKPLGRWIVKWDKATQSGSCRADGDAIRHFNIHTSILPSTLLSQFNAEK